MFPLTFQAGLITVLLVAMSDSILNASDDEILSVRSNDPGSPPCSSINPELPQVLKAQLMIKDDPLSLFHEIRGNPVCNVTIERDSTLNVYFLVVSRITDGKVLVRYKLDSNVEYVVATPSFHRWKYCNGDGSQSTDTEAEIEYGIVFSHLSKPNKFARYITYLLETIKHPELYLNREPLNCPESTVPPPVRPEKPKNLSDQAESPPPLPVRSITPPTNRSSTPPANSIGHYNNNSSLTLPTNNARPLTAPPGNSGDITPPIIHRTSLTGHGPVLKGPPRQPKPIECAFKVSHSVSNNNVHMELPDSTYTEVWQRQQPVNSAPHMTENSASQTNSPYQTHEFSEATPLMGENLTSTESPANSQPARKQNEATPRATRNPAPIEVVANPTYGRGSNTNEYSDYRRDYSSEYLGTGDVTDKPTRDSTLESVRFEIPQLPRRRRRRLWCCVPVNSSNSSSTERYQCKHCSEMYQVRDNYPGSCRIKISRSRRLIDAVTCRPVVTSCLSCCCREEESSNADRFSNETDMSCDCRCTRSKRRCRKKVAFALLGIILPCIWLHRPCVSCHKRAEIDGCCGSQHEPA